jgi:short-subunit dehydrogenase
MTDLDGAHVLVLGATGGLGSAITRRLAGAGARLSLSGRSSARLDELAGDLGGAVVGTLAADLSRPGEPERVVEQSTGTSTGAGLTGVVYAAGVVAFGPVTELDDDVFDELLLTNLVAPVRIARAAVPHLPEGGFLAQISAVVAERPAAGMAAYSATKAGLTAFGAAIAHELRRKRIRVIDVRPPHTETGLAGRPIAGTAPGLQPGLAPAAVADRIVRAIADDERDLPAAAFYG